MRLAVAVALAVVLARQCGAGPAAWHRRRTRGSSGGANGASEAGAEASTDSTPKAGGGNGGGDAAAAAADAPVSKAYTSTVAMIPPDEAWPAIQAARYALRDRGLWRWPPHVNLLYPFAPAAASATPRLIAALAAAAARVEPFDVHLEAFEHFEHKYSATLWLDPRTEPPGALDALQSALQSAAPEYHEQRSVHNGGDARGRFVPHMSVAHLSSASEAREAGERLARDWKPVSFRVDEVRVVERSIVAPRAGLVRTR